MTTVDYDNIPKCPDCGSSDVVAHIEGLCLICECNACHWSAVTTQLPEILLDESVFKVQIDIKKSDRKRAILALKQYRGVSLQEARNLCANEYVDIIEGKAFNIVQYVHDLKTQNLTLIINPEFKYTTQDLKVVETEIKA